MAGTYISMISLWLNRSITYSFGCEHCGVKGISIVHDIFCRTVFNGGNIPNTDKERDEALYNTGSYTIKSWIIQSQTKVMKGDFSFLKGKCPHCNKYQTWAMIPKNKLGIAASSAIKSIPFALLGALIFILGFAFIGTKNAESFHKLSDFLLPAISGFVIIGFLFFLRAFGKLRLKYQQYNDETKDVKEKQKPEIDWNETMQAIPVSKNDVAAKNLETALKKDRTNDNITIIYNTDHSIDIS